MSVVWFQGKMLQRNTEAGAAGNTAEVDKTNQKLYFPRSHYDIKELHLSHFQHYSNLCV